MWSCYARSTTATWDVNFEYLARNGVTTARMADFAAALRTIPGVEARLAGLEAANYRRRPSFPIDAILVKTGAVERILEAIGQLLETEPAN